MQQASGRTSASALTAFKLTYSPAHRPNGAPLNPTASRQILAERRSAVVVAATADAAVWTFERDNDRMATACRRLQDAQAEAADEGESELAI